jgi:glycerophosphoryl diester phosphodiesterase
LVTFQKPFLAQKRPLLFAHRGASYEFPENTIPAFHRAAEYNVDVFEIDVRLSADNLPVVIHDPDVVRTTGQSGNVRKMTLANLKKLNAGYYFAGSAGDFLFRAQPVPIPTLEELFSEFPRMRFNVDLKDPENAAADALWRLIEQKKLHDQIMVGSFHHATLVYFRQISAGTVATSATKREVWQLAAGFVSGTLNRFPLKMDALQLPTRQGITDLTHPRIIHAAHARNLAVHYWTVNDPHEMKSLLEKGADGLMSDDPRRLSEVFREWKRGKP